MTRIRLATSDTFRSFRSRNFRLFFGGQLISQIGNWLTLVTQTLLVYKLTNSGVALGVLAAAQFGPVLAFGAFAGLIADRSDKRRLLIAIQAFAMLQSFALAALAFMDHPPVIAILAIAVFGGLAMAFDNPTRRSFVAELVPADDINNAVSLNSALMTGARVVGPALAGLLITTVGFGWAFVFDGVSYLAVLYGLWRMDSSRLRTAPLLHRGKGQVRAGFRYARSVPELWVPLAMMAVVGTLAFNFQTVLPLFATRDLHGSTTTFTLLMSVMSAGSLLGALASARRRVVSVTLVGRMAVAFGLTMGVLTIAPNEPVAFGAAFVMGVASISFMTASTALVQTKADPSMRGRMLSLQAIVFLGSTPIGGPMVGAISQHFGARYALALGAVATLGAGLAGLVAVRRRSSLAAAAAIPLPGPLSESAEPDGAALSLT